MVSLPSQISAFCALAARSPCICSHLRVALRFAQQPTGLTLPSGALMVSLPSQISAFCALAARSPCICSHLRVALRCAQQPTGLTLPFGALRVALPPPVASAHRAHASLRAFGRSQRSGKCCGIRLWGAEGKRRLRGLPSAAQSAPQVRRREVSALWAVAAKGGKATRRREQIQGLRAVSAQNADICERANPRLRAAGAQNADICERQGSANDGATDDPPAPRPLSTSCARPALPGGAFLCPFHSPRNVIHYTQPFFPAA